jgi:hypothetical protein
MMIQWLTKLSQCFVLFDALLNNMGIKTNINKVLVYKTKSLIRATQQKKNYVILIRNHGDMTNQNQGLIDSVL